MSIRWCVHLFHFLFPLWVHLECVRALLPSANASIMASSAPEPTAVDITHVWSQYGLQVRCQLFIFCQHFSGTQFDSSVLNMIFWLWMNAWQQSCAVTWCWCGTASNNYNYTRQTYFVSNYSLPIGHWRRCSYHHSNKWCVSLKIAGQYQHQLLISNILYI